MHNFYKKFTNQGPAYFGDLDETEGDLLKFEMRAEEEGACSEFSLSIHHLFVTSSSASPAFCSSATLSF